MNDQVKFARRYFSDCFSFHALGAKALQIFICQKVNYMDSPSSKYAFNEWMMPMDFSSVDASPVPGAQKAFYLPDLCAESTSEFDLEERKNSTSCA